jgi:cysteine desulfuration protein SufE
VLVEAAKELAEDFNAIPLKERLQLLLEFSDKLPDLPERYADHPDLLERVDECQSPVYLFVEVENGVVGIFITAPKESPTTRGFASILHELLDGQAVEDVLNFDDGFPGTLGLLEAVSALRLRGMTGMLRRIKRQTREKAVA